jgi:hypothetical protein
MPYAVAGEGKGNLRNYLLPVSHYTGCTPVVKKDIAKYHSFPAARRIDA